MSALFKSPPTPPPTPAPVPPPPMPDPFSPSNLAAQKQMAATRAGRSATVLSQAGSRGTLAQGAVGVPYAGATLGGGR
jgi:hypothetical protein